MELDELFDGATEQKRSGVRLRSAFKITPDAPKAAPRLEEPLVGPEASEVAAASKHETKPPAEPKSPELEIDVSVAAREAAKAHDAYTVAKAAYDYERQKIQKQMDAQLAELAEQAAKARERKIETCRALAGAMTKDKITRIPMKDRPDIEIKTRKGAKTGITRKWLTDLEGVAIKGYEKALAGEPEFGSGVEFAARIWESQPKSEDSSNVTIPDPYEDEPDHG